MVFKVQVLTGLQGSCASDIHLTLSLQAPGSFLPKQMNEISRRSGYFTYIEGPFQM